MAGSRAPEEWLAALEETYQTLILFLNLPNETAPYVRELLGSNYVKPFWDEYRTDYLEQAGDIDLIRLLSLDAWCISENAFEVSKFTDEQMPDNEGWCQLDHATRFFVRVLTHSWDNDGEWTHGFCPDPDDYDDHFGK
ncbi:hypothetical protein F5B20DRAFT_566250 [Whalleya microplaca]|nr:hypothetical protein F5B20DRAFT_566250 [Whalleya microplaca]